MRRSADELARMRRAGRVVAEMHEKCSAAARPGVTTAELDRVAREVLERRNARSNFLNYHGFPAVICTSPNNVIVHGIPGDYRLEEGDILSLDCGAIIEGYHGDAAVTIPIGEVSPEARKLMEVTEESPQNHIARTATQTRAPPRRVPRALRRTWMNGFSAAAAAPRSPMASVTARSSAHPATPLTATERKMPHGALRVGSCVSSDTWALASNPDFDVNDLDERYTALVSDRLNNPLVNRATQGQYAPGSTFKLVSSLAMNMYGIRPYNVYYNDVGKVFIGNDWFYNDRSTSNGSVALSQAITVSSDTYFYTAGDAFWNAWNAGDTARGLGLEAEARSLGFDKKTGIEIDEVPGRIPDPTWKQNFANAYYKTAALRRDNGRWYPGDDVHLAVGQGDVLVTPLQLANAYAAFANGGTLLTPHLGMTIRDAKGHLVRRIAPKPKGTILLDPAVRAQMLLGFKGVVQSGPGAPVGTAYSAFLNFPFSSIPGGVAGKTGSAQVAGKGPTSEFVSFFPADDPQYVVVAVVEEGGYGADIAAPIVRQVIEHMTNPTAPPTPIARQSGRD